jgi:hypothetical protein
MTMLFEKDRRLNLRRATLIAATASTKFEKEKLAVIRDASSNGALLLSKAHFAIDSEIILDAVFPNKAHLSLVGLVKRSEPYETGIWRFKTGVELRLTDEERAEFLASLDAVRVACK